MSNIVADVKNGQNKDDMLRRALEQIVQLYPDKSHFVYELLQNAEDAEATEIKFIQYPDRLEVFHDGKPFTTANLQGLCDIAKSTKVNNLNQIGEFGVGFKSVFGICDKVLLYSAPDHFREKPDDNPRPFAVEIRNFVDLEGISEEEMPEKYTTRFVFPYAVGQTFSGFTTKEELVDAVSHKLKNLGIITLLFLKNLELIEYQIQLGEEPVEGSYLLEKKEINGHCLLVSALGTTGEKTNDRNSEEMFSYLKFSRPIQKYSQRTVDIAFSIRQDKDGSFQCIKSRNPYVSVYFPTDTESKLDFIVQGPYRTTPNRSNIPVEDEDNKLLAKETAILLRESILELKELGIFNMSFVKVLPISKDKFEHFNLFLPLYETVRDLFRSEAVIPGKYVKYVSAKQAKISRQERLATVFTDCLLTQLINDGHQYYWLPTYLTNNEYKPVLDYMVNELNIADIRPDALHTYFAKNPKFLPEQTDDWLVELYGLFERIPSAFSHLKYGLNLATVEIIKTESGIFVAPFRKEGETYIQNVFLPSPNIHSADIHFVDQRIYERCRSFFDDVLHLKKPNEYDFFIKNIEKRYESGWVFNAEQHIADVKALLKYVEIDEHKDEVTRIIREVLLLRCTDGRMRRAYAYSPRMFVPINSEGINIEVFFRNINPSIVFVDLDFYKTHDIDEKKLVKLGVHNSLLTGKDEVCGRYYTGSRGKSPIWSTTGDFRWKLSIEALEFVLKYISEHPSAKDSMLKSQTILNVLVDNETRLYGRVDIKSSVVPNKDNESCEMIKILCGTGMEGWNGKWLYTESGELVSPKDVSRHEISASIYGKFTEKIKSDSIILKLLGFKRTEADEVEDLKKKVSSETLEAYFERELMRRFGISTADLNARFAKTGSYVEVTEEIRPSFPSHNVRSWESLRKHAAEMLNYAVPVRYEERMQSVRVSSRSKEVRAYLQNMYRLEGNNLVFACQLCHSANFNFLATEVFLKPKKELEPINLCLCPNCSAVYRRFRGNSEIMKKVREAFLTKVDTDIETGDYVCISIDDDNELWFTQTHFAEIRELIRLEREMKKSSTGPAVQTNADDKSR